MKKLDDDQKDPNPNDPKRKIPVKPDKNPDPTKKPNNDPEKVDPTRIEEPEKHDPTRIPDPDEDDDDDNNPNKQDLSDTGLFYPINFL